jgi:L-rhamnose isomerase/sugar isomerase
VKPVLAEWRQRRNLDPNPLDAYRASGYEGRVAREREERRAAAGTSRSNSSYA